MRTRPKTDAEVNATIASHIRQYGWHCLHVFPSFPARKRQSSLRSVTASGSPSLTGPPKCLYSVYAILSECAAVLSAGGRLQADAKDDRILAGDYKVLFRPLPRTAHSQYLGTALRYYGWTKFDALVMFLPDCERRFPWERGYCGASTTALGVAARPIAVTRGRL